MRLPNPVAWVRPSPDRVGPFVASGVLPGGRRRAALVVAGAAGVGIAVAVWVGRAAGIDRGAIGAPLLGLLAFVSPAGLTLPCWASSHPPPRPARTGAPAGLWDWFRARF